MLSLIQRVTSATVTVEGEVVGTIEAGLLALVAWNRATGRPRSPAWPSACWGTGCSPTKQAG